jgi:hypothetical protein
MNDTGSPPGRVVLVGGTALLIVAATLSAQLTIPLNADAQWILTTAGRVLRGQRLYRDIIEINPPLVVWLQLPIVWLAHLSGVAAAVLFRIGMVLGGIGAAAVASAIFGRHSPGSENRAAVWAFPVILGVLLIVPGGAFGQREQMITMLLLPYLATQANRLDHCPPKSFTAACAGLAAGLAIALKPHYALVWLLVSGYRATSAPSRRFNLQVEDFAIVGTGAAYLIAVYLATPEFFSLARTYAGAYLAYTTMTRVQIIGESAAIIWLVIAIVVWRVRRAGMHRGAGAVLALAGAAAATAAIWQGKGWTYHFLPAVSFSVLLGALALAAAPREVHSRRQTAARVGAVALLLVSWVPLAQGVVWQLTRSQAGPNLLASIEQRELEAAVGGQRGARSILVLSSDMTAAQPWVASSGLVSRNSFPCLWVPAVVYHTRWNGVPRVLPRSPAEMTGAERAAFGSVVADFTGHPPDLLVIESRAKNERFTGYPGGFDHLAYYGADPRFAACLRQYQQVAALSGFEILRRSPAHAGPPARTAERSIARVGGCA